METLTLTPTPFPIMVLNDSMDYDDDNYASILKRQNDNAAFLSIPSPEIVSQPDKKNGMLIRIDLIQEFSNENSLILLQAFSKATNDEIIGWWNIIVMAARTTGTTKRVTAMQTIEASKQKGLPKRSFLDSTNSNELSSPCNSFG